MKGIHKKQSTGKRQESILGWIFCSPYLAFSLIFFLLPLMWAFWLSAMDWNLMGNDKTFVGLGNFAELFRDDKVQAAFINSYRYLLPIVLLCFAFGLLIALLVSQLSEKVKGITAVLFFIPYLTSGVATSVVVKYLLAYNSVLSTFLREKHGIDVNWLMDKRSAFAIMVILVVWKMSGYYALFILSAMGLHKLFHVTLPMITPTLTTVIVLATGLAFGIYTEPYLLTGGGPNMATTTWQLEIYNASFTRFQSGYAAAMAILNAIQIFVTLRIINVVMDRFNKRFGW